MLRKFGHPVVTCCDMLGVENPTSAHAPVQHCCTNLAKRLQHYAISTNVAWKIWPFSNLSQQHPTCLNTSQHLATWWPNARNTLRPTMLRKNVAIVWPGLISVPSLVWIMLVLRECDQQGMFESTPGCLSSCGRVEYAYINFCFWCYECELSLKHEKNEIIFTACEQQIVEANTFEIFQGGSVADWLESVGPILTASWCCSG